MNIVDEVTAIVARERAANSVEWEMERIKQAISELPGIESEGASRYLRYEIEGARGDRLKDEAEILTSLRSLEIAAAPEVAALVQTTNGYVIVRRYWACSEERLLSVADPEVALREAARSRFRRDMEVLLEHDKVHPFAGRGFSHWLVGETSGTIVLNTWSVLTAASARDRKVLLASIDELLARRAAPR